MKKLFTSLEALAVMLVCFVFLPTEVEAATESDLLFSLSDDGNSYSISDCSTYASGELIIPSTYNNKPVTSICDNAFYDCCSLTSITIPNSIKHIGSNAFAGCTNLQSINIPEGITHISTCTFLYCRSLTTLTIPDSVTSVGQDIFWGCDSLGGNIYDNAVYIGTTTNPYFILKEAISETIAQCRIHPDTKVIYDFAFADCSNLSDITIPVGVTRIGRQSFENCTGLIRVDIPNSVGYIGTYAFGNCFNLSSVDVPDSVTSMGENPFYGTKWLYSQPDGVVYAGKIAVVYKGVTMPPSLVFADGTLGIANAAFQYCNTLICVTIPASVESIGHFAFQGCQNLWHVLYMGSEEQWDGIQIEYKDQQDYLKRIRHYNYTGAESIDLTSKTCSICTPPCTHTYNNECDPSCNVCGATRTITHNYQTVWNKDASTHWHACACGAQKDSAAHSWDSGKVTKAATCKEAGVKTYICTVCKETKTEEIAKLTTHTPGAAATETTAQTCTVCGHVIQAALGHTHHYESNWSKDASTHWHTCACGVQKDSAAHSWDSGKVTKAATCKEDGVKTYTCTVCKATKTEAIAKLTTHTPGAAATETTAQTCTVCGVVLKPATGATTPPTTVPPTTVPPTTVPPTTVPPTTAPPTTVPPITTPPTTTPPTTVPPTTVPATTPTTSETTEPTIVPTQPEGNEKPDEGGFPVVAVIVIVVLAGGGAAAGVILWKKKH